MRDLIVMMGILPLLMVFVMQQAADFKSGESLETIRSLVYAAKEAARMEGGFSGELKTGLAHDIEERLGLESGSVSVEARAAVGSVGRYDADSRIEYVVRVRMKNVMAGGELMGIDEEDNFRTYVIDSFTTSEYVGGY
ncbi:MAG: hypothetical protein IJU59_01505 [Firmicutes bacterium]|nr:hypothetical protein [Bacillota bacterium]